MAADLLIHHQDGSVQTIPLADIQNIGYLEMETSLQILITNGTDVEILLSDIQKLTYGNLVGISEKELELIETFTLIRSYPNPFNSSTTIEFDLPNPGKIEAAIYNIFGQKVKTLSDQHFPSGHTKISWAGDSDSGLSVASGAYICKVNFDNNQLVTRLMYVK